MDRRHCIPVQPRHARKKKTITVPYKVKSGDIKLPSWPTTPAFPAWRRTLRHAVISAPDRPERARPWIFAVENDDIMMEDLACADDDRHRTLDAKLAEAQTKILSRASQRGRWRSQPSERRCLRRRSVAASASCSSTRSSDALRRRRTRRPTPGLHNKFPAHKIFARVWVAQEPICS